MSQDIRKSFTDSKKKGTTKGSVQNIEKQDSLASLGTPVTSALKRSNADLSPPSPAMEANIVSKINEMIDKKINQWGEKLDSIKEEIVSRNQEKIQDLQKAFSDTIDVKLDGVKQEIDKSCSSFLAEIKTVVAELSQEVQEQRTEIVTLKFQLEQEKRKRLTLEAYSRRSNLKVMYIPENIQELRVHILDIFNRESISICDSDIDQVHRIGKFRQHSRTPRPVIVRFTSMRARMAVWEKRMHFREEPTGKPLLKEDIPQEWQSSRRTLWPIMMKARKLKKTDGTGYSANLVRDCLMLDNKPFSLNNLSDLPPALQPASIYTPMSDDVVLFFTQYSPFSNHHRCSFTVDNVKYNSSEQFIMRQKCLLAGDDDIAKKVMMENSPVTQKHLGKSIKHFEKNKWEKEAKSLIRAGIREKVVQNTYIKKLLISTGKRRIAEANGFDRLFAIGYNLEDERAWDIKNWGRGQNIMGALLEEIRDELMD